MKQQLVDLEQWLDTETRAILCADPPDKLIGAATAPFSLLLVTKGKDENRIAEIVSAIQRYAPHKRREYPFVVAQQLKLNEATAGQLALVC